jgi:hypothetical protein
VFGAALPLGSFAISLVIISYVHSSLTESVSIGIEGYQVEPLEEQLASWEKASNSVVPTTSSGTDNIEDIVPTNNAW